MSQSRSQETEGSGDVESTIFTRISLVSSLEIYFKLLRRRQKALKSEEFLISAYLRINIRIIYPLKWNNADIFPIVESCWHVLMKFSFHFPIIELKSRETQK